MVDGVGWCVGVYVYNSFPQEIMVIIFWIFLRLKMRFVVLWVVWKISSSFNIG